MESEWFFFYLFSLVQLRTVCMHTTQYSHHHPLTPHLVWGRTRALTASSCPRSSKPFLSFLCPTSQSKGNERMGTTNEDTVSQLRLYKQLITKHETLILYLSVNTAERLWSANTNTAWPPLNHKNENERAQIQWAWEPHWSGKSNRYKQFQYACYSYSVILSLTFLIGSI